MMRETETVVMFRVHCVLVVYYVVVCWYLVVLEIPSFRFKDAPWFVRGWLKFLTYWNLVSIITFNYSESS